MHACMQVETYIASSCDEDGLLLSIYGAEVEPLLQQLLQSLVVPCSRSCEPPWLLVSKGLFTIAHCLEDGCC